MIILRGTQKFLSFSGIRPQDVADGGQGSTPPPEWYVNLLYLDRKKHLLFTHRSALFTFIVMAVLKKDTGNLLELFRKGLSRAMFYTHCPSDMMQKVLQGCEGVLVAKTRDRSVLSSMNDMAYKVPWWLSKVAEGQDPAAIVALRLNGMPMGALKYKCPIEMFSALYGFKVGPDIKDIFLGEKEDDQDAEQEQELGEHILAELKDADPSHIAQELAYEAWNRQDLDERIGLARKALTMYPQCADAYVILAQCSKRNIKDAAAFYLEGVKAGRVALGDDFFKTNTGRFWIHMETRPYMRALAGLQDCYWHQRRWDDAIAICHDMLRLNENDNQGMRYVLIRYLARLFRYDDLERFMEHSSYSNDCAAEWCFTRAWLRFLREGGTEYSNKLLKRALGTNQFVPKYLFKKGYCLKNIPDRISMGGEDEAQCYAHEFGSVWHNSSGAMDWLRITAG